jgi:hypothetical protein
VRRPAIPLLCAGFVVIGLALLVQGPAHARIAGAVTVLCFGFGGLALALPFLTPRGAASVRLIEFEGEPAFLFALGAAKQAVAALASAGMAGAGVLLVVIGNPLGLLGTLFFGPVAVKLAVGSRRVRGLVLTRRDVVAIALGRVEIPWPAVRDASVSTVFRARVLTVAARDAGAVRGGRLARFNARLSGADLTLAAEQFAGDPERAAAAVNRYVQDVQARERIGTEPELQALLA